MEQLEQPAEKGSTIMGKFKDREELEKAYRELEGEFTRRAQEAGKLAAENKQLKAQMEEPGEDKDVEAFLEEYPDAKNFVDAITTVLEENNNLEGRDGLAKAYMLALSRGYRKPEELAQDEDFLQTNILNNQQIRDRILKDYLSSLTTSPTKLVGTGAMPVCAHGRPSNMKAAGELARAFFRK